MRKFVGIWLLTALVALACVPGHAFADAGAEQALFAAYESMLGSRCATETVSRDGKGKETRTLTEFDTLDRIRVTSDQISFVILPEGTWMRAGGGDWSQPPIDMSAMFKGLMPMTLKDVRAGTRNIRDEGMRTSNGVSLRAISYDVSTQFMGITVNSQVTAYLDEAGRIVRSESVGEAMGQKTQVVQTIRYDDSIRISPPG